MDRKMADRIIVKSNERMKMVMDWYGKNAMTFKDEEFRSPMDVGVIELQEERIEITFEGRGPIIELGVYSLDRPELPAMVTYDFNAESGRIMNLRYADILSDEKKMLMNALISLDQMHIKCAYKYRALMQFMVRYVETVKITETGRRSKREAKEYRKDLKRPLPLIRKRYEIEGVDLRDLRMHGEKRSYTKPDHEVSVRGYIRHYKSGKTVWIEPSVRYKGKNRKHKDYQL